MTNAPNRNPCESSFRMIDKRITVGQRNAMSDLDLYLGIDSYYVLEDGRVDVHVCGEYYCTFNRAGDMILIYSEFDN